MSLLGKGLLGLLLGGSKSEPSMPSYLRNASGSYQPRSRFKRYHCAYCGKFVSTSGIPNCKTGGPCRNSPYGTHYYMEDWHEEEKN